jgi:hypothetical protein
VPGVWPEGSAIAGLLVASLIPSPAPAAPNKAVLTPCLLLQHHHSHLQASPLSNSHQPFYITAKMVKAGEFSLTRHSRYHFGQRWGSHCAELSTLYPRRPVAVLTQPVNGPIQQSSSCVRTLMERRRARVPGRSLVLLQSAASPTRHPDGSYHHPPGPRACRQRVGLIHKQAMKLTAASRCHPWRLQRQGNRHLRAGRRELADDHLMGHLWPRRQR